MRLAVLLRLEVLLYQARLVTGHPEIIHLQEQYEHPRVEAIRERLLNEPEAPAPDPEVQPGADLLTKTTAINKENSLCYLSRLNR